MTQANGTGWRFAFGDFVFDFAEAALMRRGNSVPIAPKELELLQVLVSHAGHLVLKEDLIRQVWPHTFVSDSSLLRNISVLRRHLGYDAIRTVPKRGYVFALPVVKLARSGTAVPNGVVREEQVVFAESNSKPAEEQNPEYSGSTVSTYRWEKTRSDSLREKPAWRTWHAASLAVVVLFVTAIYPGLPHARTVSDSVHGASLSAAVIPHENAESARLCKIAWFYRNKATLGDLEKAIAFFRQAVKIAPNDPRAWAGLADALASEVQTAQLDQERSAALDSAKLAAQQALLYGTSVPDAHMAAGVVDWQAGNITHAEKELQEALELNPQYGEAQYVYASMLSETGKLSAAKAAYDRALQLEPSSVRVVANAATLYARIGQNDQALQLLHRAIDMNSESVLVYGDLGQVLTRMHRYREAAAAFHRARMLTGEFKPDNYGAPEAYCLSQVGKNDQARAELRKLNMRSERQASEDLAIAILYSGLHQNNAAEEALRQAIAAGEVTPQVAADQPYFEPLRHDAVFAQLTSATEQR